MLWYIVIRYFRATDKIIDKETGADAETWEGILRVLRGRNQTYIRFDKYFNYFLERINGQY